jgi:hypothetical protein
LIAGSFMADFDPARLIDRMEAFAAAPRTVIGHASTAEARRKPASGAWSILEIVCHLVDEEVEDFRARLRSTIETPSAPWPPIDPEGIAKSRRYNDRELAPMLDAFERERRASIAWLRSLPADAPWTMTYTHPKVGPLHAGMLLASWAAHDQLHLRQLAKRLYELCAENAGPYPIDYAGAWGP